MGLKSIQSLLTKNYKKILTGILYTTLEHCFNLWILT